MNYAIVFSNEQNSEVYQVSVPDLPGCNISVETIDIGLEKILPIALKANIQTYLIEASNPRHAHEWKVFENIKLPNNKVIVPGVIDSTSNFVEHEELVKNRIIQYSKVIDKEPLV